ncbi:MAG: hypothetical protein E5V22_06285 [Mesorhizobium sp.]|uniref:hypothetical protein n=1 Tax=Mesorhizobium sp. TaxID=1871066 RepID=UPI000FE6510C|nr:hypothetical protein [Mesorhizobium sp.]RWE53849.1 MAG: hypothetical protein EOS24_26010 [Mesorhizobium sp.]TIY05706.1 MAG: hypothetical protein E5V22_06285 [Mesorhizobium sp.]
MHKFHCGLIETAAGPSIGAIADLGDLFLKARDAGLSPDEEVRFADLLNFATQNTIFANLFYVRPTLDFLFLSSMREVASPGYTRRVDRSRRKQYGQRSVFPKPLDPFGGFK